MAGFTLVILVACFGVALAVQGWQSRMPAHDLVPHIINAHNLAATGAIPVHGDTGSYGSYKPPGTAWFMLPSTLLFSDPRLAEYVGAGFLHLATLLGIFLLANDMFGFWCAGLAVLMYGLSSTGILLAGSLWPNGRPDFYIWTVLFAARWANRKDAKSLAMAAATWAVGMNVDMALLPAIFVLPALWWVYRPPIRFRYLLPAVALILIVWFPYLRFETGRGFADVRSQVLFQNIFPPSYRHAWCNPNATLVDMTDPAPQAGAVSTATQAYQGPALGRGAIAFAGEIAGKLLDNFGDDTALFPPIGLLLLLVAIASLVLFATLNDPAGISGGRHLAWLPVDRTTGLALVMIGMGALADEFVVSRVLGLQSSIPFAILRNLRTIEKLLILGGVSILLFRWLVAHVGSLLAKVDIQLQTREQAERRLLLSLALAIPWFILLLVAEPGKPERFWWLWPMQATFLAAFIVWFLPRVRVARPVTLTTGAVAVVLIAWNPFLLARLTDWVRNGWSGSEAPEAQAVEFVTGQLEAKGRNQAAIGYNLFNYDFMATYHVTNPEYKVGSDFDLLFRYPHRVTNLDQCAEGTSPADEYRIVQTSPKSDPQAPRSYFDAPLPSGFRLLRQFGPYEVFARP